MTMDKSLKVRQGLARARSVLSRAERLERLKSTERWKDGDCPLGLPKVRVYKLAMKKKKKKKEEEGGRRLARRRLRRRPPPARKKAARSSSTHGLPCVLRQKGWAKKPIPSLFLGFSRRHSWQHCSPTSGDAQAVPAHLAPVEGL